MPLSAAIAAAPVVEDIKESEEEYLRSNCRELIPVDPGVNPMDRVTLDPGSPEPDPTDMPAVCANAWPPRIIPNTMTAKRLTVARIPEKRVLPSLATQV